MTRAIEVMRRRKLSWRNLAGAAAALAVVVAVSITASRDFSATRNAGARNISRAHGPWIYGNPAARFTLIEYTDLECPYCRAYFPVLRRWIGKHPQVNWEWRSLPLPMHEPAASREALLAECAGEANGNGAFWQAVAWIYGHTRGDGAGIAAGARMPGMSPAVRACLKSARAEGAIRAEVADAAREHITGTPTLRLVDQKTRRSLELQGSVAGDVLLSALDLLTSRPDRPASAEDNSR